MSSEYTIETRRRSRSKTPFLRSNCDHENCEHAGEEGHVHHHHPQHKKKVPTVQSIAEETHEVTSPVKVKAVKTKTSDYSSEDISPDNSKKGGKSLSHTANSSEEKHQQHRRELSETTTTTTKNMTSNTSKIITSSSSTKVVTSKRIDRLNEEGSVGTGGSAVTSTPKFSKMVQNFASQFADAGVTSIGGGSRRKEITQNALNVEREASDISLSGSGFISSKRQNNRSAGDIHDNSASFNRTPRTAPSFTGNISDHLAYMEYKNAGEYWNVTPKTDYTYSEFSPHRRVLGNGIVAMPNMSRKSLENFNDRAHLMAQHEQHILRRHQFDSNTNRLLYDSADELDQSYRKHQLSTESSWFLIRFIKTIVNKMTTTFNDFAGLNRSAPIRVRKSAVYGTKVGTSEGIGFLGNVKSGISSAYNGLSRYIGILLSSILLLDTWLLTSRSSDGKVETGARRGVKNPNNKRRWWLLWLLFFLLPLLLLTGWYLTSAEDRLIYVEQAKGYVPVKLVSNWRSTLQSTSDSLKGYLPNTSSFSWPSYFSFSWPASLGLSSWWLWLWGSSAAKKTSDLHIQQLQSALTPAEYEQLLLHVNGYVQQLVDVKMEQQRAEILLAAQRISPEQMQVIVKVMHENLERFAREKRDINNNQEATKDFQLSDMELRRLADLVQQQLRASGQWNIEEPVHLSADNLADIKRLITEHIEVNNHAHYNLLVERIDLDALLLRLLAAPQLADFVDSRIGVAIDGRLVKLQTAQQQAEKIRRKDQQQQEASISFAANEKLQEEHQRIIMDLNKEISFIKLAVSDKQSENEGLQQSIMRLKVTQDDLLQRLQQHELATDKRFIGLLAEIESKLAALNDETHFTKMNQQIKLSLLEILGFKQSSVGLNGKVQMEDADLQAWVRNMFVAKDYLEQRLLELNNRTHNRIRDEIDRSGVLLMRDISARLKEDVLTAVHQNHAENAAMLKGHIRAALSEEEVQKIVKSVLAIYDADKTGLVDFALESAGGQILSTRCTESYQTKTAQLSIFGIPLWYPTNTPRVAISPNVQPGECWAFQGFPGFLVLKLNSLVYVTGFTLEHIPRSLSPNGRIDSAPRNFTVWGLEHEKDYEPILFGEYEYADNDASLQYFPVMNKKINRPYDIVELRIESNHGHAQYTCLYRFRVHGKPPTI